MTDPKEGDIVGILVAGGYGTSMSFNYNMRALAAEVLVKDKEIVLIKKRQTYEDIVSLFTK